MSAGPVYPMPNEDEIEGAVVRLKGALRAALWDELDKINPPQPWGADPASEAQRLNREAWERENG
jgi:hypothetical protein